MTPASSMNLEWVRETMHQLGEQMIELRRDVSDVRERLIRMEASTVHSVVETLTTDLRAIHDRVDKLESIKDRKDGIDTGVSKTADWLYKLAPWIFATGLVVLTNWQRLAGH